MKIIEWFLELFRKKEFYQIDYNELNNFSVTFKEITDADLDKFRVIIIDFVEAEFIDDFKANLLEDVSLKFSDIDELMEKVKHTVIEDYQKTYFEANNNKWDFNYFVTNYEPMYQSSLFICNRLFYPSDNNRGEVMYPLLAVRKYCGKFYFWNLLEKYDGFV